MVSGNEEPKLDELYYEIAKNNAHNRNIVVARSELGDYIGEGKVVYRSMYGYKNTLKDHMTIAKSVQSFKDTCYIENLVFDLDSHYEDKENKKDTEVFDDPVKLKKVLTDAVYGVKELIRLIAEMTGTPEYSIPIWYSGRGFHLQTPDFFHFKPSTYLREEVEATMKHFFPMIDHLPYMTSGLIRLNYSYNAKSKTYKIPVHYQDLTHIDDILIRAKSYMEDGKLIKVKYDEWDAYDLSDKIIVAQEKARFEVNKHNTTRIVTCVQNMFNAGSIKGQSHNMLLRMLTVWRKQGMTYGQSLILAKAWVDKGWSDYEVTNQVNSVWKNRYLPYGCQDNLMAKYCDQDCIYYKNRNYNIAIDDNVTILQKLAQRIKDDNDPENPSFDLKNVFDLPVEIKFRKGQAILLFGHPKIGKSFWMQYVCQKAKIKTLYYTLEMPVEEIIQRQVSIQLEEDIFKVEQRVLQGEDIYEMSELIKHITFIGISPTLSDIRAHIENYEPEWVIIDTVGYISEDQFKGNETLKLNYIFEELKKMAITYKVVILVIQHIVNGVDEKGKLKPLNMFSGLYSKTGSRAFDKILGWEGYQDQPRRKLSMLGNREGVYFTKYMVFDKEKSVLTPVIQ